ncbi:MAG TPA: GNAT family N-acetyltransferase [Candidatus Limnocylindrales bacterium]
MIAEDLFLQDQSPDDLAPLREELIALCAQAFAPDPWRDPPGRAVKVVDRIYDSVGKPAFRLVTCRVDGELVGFGYGCVDVFCAGLAPPNLGCDKAFELVDLAVAPMFQGLGIGRRVHDTLLADAPCPRMLLTHQALELRSRYARWGWQDLGDVVIPGSGATLALMAQMG